MADFDPAAAAGEGGFFVEAEGGHDDNVNWNEPNHREDKLPGVRDEVEGALVEVGAHEVGKQKRRQNGTGVTKNQKNVEHQP